MIEEDRKSRKEGEWQKENDRRIIMN